MVAKPCLVSEKEPDAIFGALIPHGRLFGAHYSPLGVWMIYFRTLDKMRDLNRVFCPVATGIGENGTYAGFPRTKALVEAACGAACADETPVQLLKHRRRRRCRIKLQFSNKSVRSRRATFDKL